jgi:hypothetical protein
VRSVDRCRWEEHVSLPFPGHSGYIHGRFFTPFSESFFWRVSVMKLHPFARVLFPTLLAVPSLLLQAADPASSAAGYWSGGITLPNQELAVAVELAPAGTAWQGTIDIPMQGMRGFKLDGVKVSDSAVEFALPGIPGNPTFAGNLAADGKSITGTFSQGGGHMPFHLQRATKPAPRVEESTPAHGVPGKGVVGRWRGGISPMPNVELRLALELSTAASGAIEGVVVSLDQGSARIPIAGLKYEDNKVTFETPSVQASFSGVMNADGSEIAGEWTQMGRSTPLVFKRLAATK